MFRKREPIDELLLPPLPESCHQADKDWIQSILSTMPRQTHSALCQGYTRIYDSHANDVSLSEVQRTNAARKQANAWLREKHARYVKVITDRDSIDILHAKSSPF